jgi:hypothetical protein
MVIKKKVKHGYMSLPSRPASVRINESADERRKRLERIDKEKDELQRQRSLELYSDANLLKNFIRKHGSNSRLQKFLFRVIEFRYPQPSHAVDGEYRMAYVNPAPTGIGRIIEIDELYREPQFHIRVIAPIPLSSETIPTVTVTKKDIIRFLNEESLEKLEKYIKIYNLKHGDEPHFLISKKKYFDSRKETEIDPNRRYTKYITRKKKSVKPKQKRKCKCEVR